MTAVTRTVRLDHSGHPIPTFTASCACGWTTGPLPTAGMAHGAIGRHLGRDIPSHPSELCPHLDPR